MKESIHNAYRFLQANSNVLWDNKFTCYILGNDK